MRGFSADGDVRANERALRPTASLRPGSWP